MKKIVLPNRQPEGIGAWCEWDFRKLDIPQNILSSPDYLRERYPRWPFKKNIFRIWLNLLEKDEKFTGVCQDTYGLSGLVGCWSEKYLDFPKQYDVSAIANGGTQKPIQYSGVIHEQRSVFSEGRDFYASGFCVMANEISGVLNFIMRLRKPIEHLQNQLPTYIESW